MPADGSLEALRPALHVILDELALAADAARLDALLGYLSLLRRWNATYNLTSVRDPAQMLVHHLADCLSVIGPLRRVCADAEGSRLLDVGSGGGLPGAVIAILEARIDVTCVDAVGKKAAFVQQVAGELQLGNLHAQHARVEALRGEPFHVITARAFSSLSELVRLTRAHLADRGVWMAMKGKVPTEEMAGLPGDVDVFHVEHLAVPGLGGDRCLVWMRLRT
jgi:16S rRNA (guanine527-N7)-methyltransferase